MPWFDKQCEESYNAVSVLLKLVSFLPISRAGHQSQFKEFEPLFKSAYNRFQLSAGLNLETIQFQVKQTIFEPRLKFKPRLKVFKFGLGTIYFMWSSIVLKLFLIRFSM